jgi:hypothetical protein
MLINGCAAHDAHNPGSQFDWWNGQYSQPKVAQRCGQPSGDSCPVRNKSPQMWQNLSGIVPLPRQSLHVPASLRILFDGCPPIPHAFEIASAQSLLRIISPMYY